MKVYGPQVQIRLIKTARRALIGGDISAAARYQDLAAIDLTPYLMEGAPVSVQQFIGGGAGTWSCVLADKMMPELRETLYAMIEPMDLVEIRMAHAPHEYGVAQGGGFNLPIVMRGFVSSIQRTRTMADGRPSRTIQISGHDYTKLLEILRIYYLNNSAIGDNIMSELKIFQKYLGNDQSKIMEADAFVRLMLDAVINPFISRITVDADGQKVGAAVVHQLLPEVTITGTVSPYAISAFPEGSVLQFLMQFLDVGAFNEMFVDEREDSVVLVVRPNQFMDLNHNVLQLGQQSAASDSTPQSLDVQVLQIPDIDIESITEGRSDEGVANYYWATSSNWVLFNNLTQRELAEASPTADYALFEYVNTNAARYGFRKMEVTSTLGPSDQAYPDEPTATMQQGETSRRKAWLVKRRKILADQNKDNAVLEYGSIVLRGNERIKRGMYLLIDFGDLSSMYYVVSVRHQFVPMQSFRTIVSFERGTSFVDRAKRADAAYLAEMNLRGAT